ncbi:MAG: NrsF family protein [Gammaproteobacteria bacterium]
MNTDDLISMLARDAAVPPLRAGAFAAPLLAAAALSAALLAGLFGLRHDLALLAASPWFWIKLAFVGALAAVGWRALARAAVPGARLDGARLGLMLALVLMALVAAVTLVQADADTRTQLIWGRTWRTCPFIIAGLSIPVFTASLHILRRRAPTRLRLAGAIAGFASGAIAAAVYCLHCPELAPSFIGIWYLAGILIPTAVGALIGRAVLAW